jgi:hypothetical protein
MIDLLAQNGPPVLPELPPWQEWWHYGPLGILALLACATVVLLLAAIGVYLWMVVLPDRRAKAVLEQKRIELSMQSDHSERLLEIAAKEKTLKVVDMLTDTIPAIVTTQQEIVHSQRKLAEVADRMDLRQQPHANECKRTNEQVELIARHLKVIT